MEYLYCRRLDFSKDGWFDYICAQDGPDGSVCCKLTPTASEALSDLSRRNNFLQCRVPANACIVWSIWRRKQGLNIACARVFMWVSTASLSALVSAAWICISLTKCISWKSRSLFVLPHQKDSITAHLNHTKYLYIKPIKASISPGLTASMQIGSTQ